MASLRLFSKDTQTGSPCISYLSFLLQLLSPWTFHGLRCLASSEARFLFKFTNNRHTYTLYEEQVDSHFPRTTYTDKQCMTLHYAFIDYATCFGYYFEHCQEASTLGFSTARTVLTNHVPGDVAQGGNSVGKKRVWV